MVSFTVISAYFYRHAQLANRIQAYTRMYVDIYIFFFFTYLLQLMIGLSFIYEYVCVNMTFLYHMPLLHYFLAILLLDRAICEEYN